MLTGLTGIPLGGEEQTRTEIRKSGVTLYGTLTILLITEQITQEFQILTQIQIHATQKEWEYIGGQGHIPILNALFNNEDFVADYINRWADLGNSYFSCDFMIQHLDSLIDLIDPEMPAQINTWGGNINTWQNNVQDLKDFILDRCNTINSGIVDCYDVTGPYNVTVIINGIGEVQFSDIFINELNSGWSGEYFGDVNIPAEIVKGNFSYWEIVSNGNYIYDPFDPNLTLNLTSDITLIAYFDANGITYLTNPINEGTITENGNIITNFPYSKSYIDGDIINLNGAANTGWEISHWSSTSNHNFTPDSVSSDVSITVNGGDTIILHLDKIELTTTILIGEEIVTVKYILMVI